MEIFAQATVQRIPNILRNTDILTHMLNGIRSTTTAISFGEPCFRQRTFLLMANDLTRQENVYNKFIGVETILWN